MKSTGLKQLTGADACAIRASIRTKENISVETLTGIFKKEIPYEQEKHQLYMRGFFEECSPSLILDFMEEKDITWQQILDIFYLIPPVYGETWNFRRFLAGGFWGKYLNVYECPGTCKDGKEPEPRGNLCDRCKEACENGRIKGNIIITRYGAKLRKESDVVK